MNQGSLSTYPLLVIAFALTGCFGGSNGNGVANKPDGGDDGSSHVDGGDTQNNGGTGGSAIGSGGSGGTKGDSDAGTTVVVTKPHKILYWGDYDKDDALSVTVMDVPSGKKRSVDTSQITQSGDVGVTPDGKLLIIFQDGYIDTDGVTAVDPKVYTLNTETSETKLLVQGKGSSGYWRSWTISQDGSMLALSISDDNGVNAIVCNTAGTDQPQAVATGQPGQSIGKLAFSAEGSLAIGVEDSSNLVGLAVLKESGGVWSGTSLPTAITIQSDLVWGPNETLYYFAQDTGMAYHLLAYDATSDKESEVEGAASLLSNTTDVGDATVTADGKYLVFKSDNEVTDHQDAFVVSLADGTTKQITHFGNASPQGDIDDLIVGSDSKSLVMAVRWDVPDGQSGVTGSMIVTDLAGKQKMRSDAGETTYQVDATSEGFSPDATMIYFTSDARTKGVSELYGIEIADPPPNAWMMPLVEVDSTIPDGDIEGVLAIP
ncbi:MAG TPA: hypothetical protein VHM19_17100 [Polyangiales bacterium]|jgi:hypothetical protein|nr:hypothetical protein [Polyangiales bacterium]